MRARAPAPRRGEGRRRSMAVLRAPGLRQPATGQAAYAAVVRRSGRAHHRAERADRRSCRRWWPSILAGTRPLRSISASRAWGRSSAPGCSASSATTRTGYADARARKNYSGHSPITRASGKKSVVLARYATQQSSRRRAARKAFSSLRASPGARAYYDALRARKHRPPRRAAPAREPAASASCTAA